MLAALAPVAGAHGTTGAAVALLADRPPMLDLPLAADERDLLDRASA